RDLTGVTFAGPRGKEAKTTFLVVEGDFSTLKLEGRLAAAARDRPDEVRVSAAGGAAVYEIRPARARNYAALVNKTPLAAAATREALADAGARADGSRKSGLAKGIKALLEAAPDGASISFAATGPALSQLLDGSAIPNAETAAAALKVIDGLSGSVTIA